MDSSLLHQLLTMMQIEDDPANEFQTKDIDLATFSPKCPNVIIVDQNLDTSLSPTPYIRSTSPSTADTAHGPVQYEFGTNSLTLACEVVMQGQQQFGRFAPLIPPIADRKGWTIFFIQSSEFSSFEIEIVGLRNVRLLFAKRDKVPIEVSAKVSLRNMRIYDLSDSVGSSATIFVTANHATQPTILLVDVKIHAPTENALVMKPKSGAYLEGCAILGCREGIRFDGAKVQIVDSLVSKCFRKGIIVRYDSEMTLMRSRFVGQNLVFVQANCKVTISGCRFQHDPGFVHAGTDFTGVKGAVALLVVMGSSLICRDGCSFRGFDEVVLAEGSNVKVLITGCTISVCYTVGPASENASLIITDNDISLFGPLVSSLANEEGQVKFLRNTLSPSTLPIIKTDKRSIKPTHDLANVIFEDSFINSNAPCAAQRSKHTKAVKDLGRQLGRVNLDDVFCLKYKKCGKCMKPEDLEAVGPGLRVQSAKPNESFKICSGCKRVAYCSVECQRAHWRDHRLSCSIKKSS